jgi:hypothetical protein
MSTMTQEMADTIKGQLGNKATVMLGATDFGWSAESGFTFRIRGCKTVSHIRIKVRQDLYDIEFLKTGRRGRGMNAHYYCDTVARSLGIDAEGMHGAIEMHTGLRTSL